MANFNTSGGFFSALLSKLIALALLKKQSSYDISLTGTGGNVPGDTSNRLSTLGTHASPCYGVLDILINKVYGLGREITVDDIDLESFLKAYTIEQDTSSAQAGEYPTTCRGIMEGARSAKELIDALLLVGKANLTTLNGKITYIPNYYLGTDLETKALASTIQFNESNILGGIHKIKFAPSNKVLNRITATVPVTNSKTREIYTLLIKDDNALAEDNNFPSEHTMAINLAAVQLDDSGEPEDKSLEIVEEICRVALRRTRLQISGKFNINYWDYPNLKCGDIIEISSKRFNLTGDDTLLAKVTRIALKSNGLETLHWQQYSNLIYDISKTDITTVTRGSIPEDAYNTPDTYTTKGPKGDDGSTGISNRLTVAYAPNADGSDAIFPIGLLTGNVDAIKIVLADAADSTSDEIFLTNMISTVDNSFLKNTGTATGTTLSFRGATTNGATGTTARLGFNQPANTTIASQIDAAISDFNTIEKLGSATATTIGNFILQRNSIAVKIDEESFYLLRLTNDTQSATPGSNVNSWNGGTPVVTNESVQRNTYRPAESRITDIYLGDELVTWEAPAAEPAVSTSASSYVWTKIQGDTGATGDSPFSIYRVSTSLPGTPTGGSYNSTTDILTPPSGWNNTVSAAKAAAGAGKLYQSNVKYLFRTNTLTTWQDPFDVGQGAPQLTALAVNDKGTSGDNRKFDIVSTLTDDEGNTSTVTSNEFELPDKLSGLDDVSISTGASTDQALYWNASSDNMQQISYKDIIDSGKSTSSIGYIPTAPGSNGTYTLTKDGSTFSWAADATGNIPTLPTTNGSYHLVRLNGVYSWAEDLEGYLPNAGPTSDGSYNLKRVSGALTWEADGAGGIPTIPSGIPTNTNKVYNLKLTDSGGAETATWEEDTGLASYIPSTQPTSNKKYVLDTTGGTATWVEVQGDNIPDSPSSDILLDKQYQLKVGLGGHTPPNTSWVEADAVPSYFPTFQPFANGKYRLSTNNSGITMFWEDDEIPDVPASNGEYSLKKNGSSVTWSITGANGVTLPTSNGEFALARIAGVYSYFNPNSFGLPDLPTGNGEYILRRLSGSWTWIDKALVFDLPNAPTSNGVYALTRDGGNNTWTDQTGTLSLPSIPSGDGNYELNVASEIGSWNTAKQPAIISNGSNDPTLNTDTGTTASKIKELIGANEGFTGGTYDSSTGIITFTSDDSLGFSTGDVRGDTGPTSTVQGPKGDGWTSVTYNSSTGKVTFVSSDGLGFVSDDIRGGPTGATGAAITGHTGTPTAVQFVNSDGTDVGSAINLKGETGDSPVFSSNVTVTKIATGGDPTASIGGTDLIPVLSLGIVTGDTGLTGDGWTGATYNASTGQVTFTSDDGLSFVTGDLRGAASTVAGPDGVGFKNYATLTTFDIGDVVISGNTQWRVLTAVSATNTTEPAENSTWSELLTKSQDQSGGGGGTASSLDTHYAKFALSDTIVGPTNDNGLDTLWFSDPDLLTEPGYTHTSVRRTTHTTEGESTRHQYTISGNGGGSLTEAADATISGTGGKLVGDITGGSNSSVSNADNINSNIVKFQGRLFGGGSSGKIYEVVPSGPTVTLIATLGNDTFFRQSLATDGTTLAAITTKGKVWTTTNGDDWFARGTAGTGNYCLAYGDGIWATVSISGTAVVRTTTDITGSWNSRANLGSLFDNAYIAYGDGVWVAVIDTASFGSGRVKLFTQTDVDASSWDTTFDSALLGSGTIATDGKGNWVMGDSNLNKLLISTDPLVDWSIKDPGLSSSSDDVNMVATDGYNWLIVGQGEVIHTKDITGTWNNLSWGGGTSNEVNVCYLDGTDVFALGRTDRYGSYTYSTSGVGVSSYVLTLDTDFSSSTITGTFGDEPSDIEVAAKIRSDINAAITAGTCEDITVEAGTDDVVKLRPTIAGDFDTPLLVFSGGGDLSAVIVVNQDTPVGSESSVLTITKTNGQRNGTYSHNLETSSTLISQIDEINTGIDGAGLYLRVIKIDSDTFQVTSIEQEACTIAVSVTAGATPAGSAAVSQTIVRAGTNPVVTLQGDAWSRPVNSGVAPI